LFYELFVKSNRLRHSHNIRRVAFTPLEKRHLSGEIFRGSNLDWLDFSGADLQGARFEGASLCGCDFSGADLTGTVFWDCDLRWARFDHTIFGNNSFRGSWLNGAEGITRFLSEYIRTRGGHFVCRSSSRSSTDKTAWRSESDSNSRIWTQSVSHPKASSSSSRSKRVVFGFRLLFGGTAPAEGEGSPYRESLGDEFLAACGRFFIALCSDQKACNPGLCESVQGCAPEHDKVMRLHAQSAAIENGFVLSALAGRVSARTHHLPQCQA